VCGFGATMEGIAREVEQVRDAGFKLKFVIPTAESMADMRRVNADLKSDRSEGRGLLTLEELAEALERGEISPDQLPAKLVRQLSEHLNQLRLTDDNS